MVRIITRALVLALVAASVQTTAQSSEAESQQQQTCIAPTVVTTLEAKIQSLEQTNAQWATATSKWTNEKSALEKQLVDVQTQHRDAIAKATELDKKIVESEQTHQQAAKQVLTLEKSVQQLTTQLSTEKQTTAKQTEELENALKKVQTYADKIKGLEREVATARKNNEALRVELEKSDDKLTLSSLLSLYYDEGVIMSSHVLETVKARTEESLVQMTEAVTGLDLAKLSAWKTVEKVYAEHLASTVDPLVADVHRAMDPHVAAYRPIVNAYVKQTKKTALQWYKKTIKRANRARGEATRLLQQQPSMAPYASTIVDGAIALVTIPLIIVVVRVVLNAGWWVLTTIICVLSCGCCCGAKKRTKLKRKMSRKQLAGVSTSTNTTSTTSKKTTASPATTSTEKRRTSGKKK